VERDSPYPPIADYGLIGDCHTAALVSRAGSIDWCCLPRFDSDSCFGRLLDWNNGGYFAVTPEGPCATHRKYLRNSLILVTTFKSGANEAQLIDFFAMRVGGRQRPRRKLIRILRGVRGKMRFNVTVVPRLDFCEVKPWIFPAGRHGFGAVGSNTGLLIMGDVSLEKREDHTLCGQTEVAARDRRRIAVQFFPPEEMKQKRIRADTLTRIDAEFDETRAWWKMWTAKIHAADGSGPGIKRSAIVLKALTYAPTGAIIAAPTTSLPEEIGGERNWDYRCCWIRDSIYTVHALSNLGAEAEADGVRRFIQRSAAGKAEELQVLYAVDGKRRITETALENLEGWRGSRPVRVGNAAEGQYQADMYGTIVELAWRWSQRGDCPEAPWWAFLTEIVEATILRWRQPDRGIWEVRSTPLHFVHSKVMCWAAVEGGIALAQRHGLTAPITRWQHARDVIRQEIESLGVDRRRGIFVRSFGSKHVDAALLLLPGVEFVAYDDPRMVRTVDVIRSSLSRDSGLIVRYLGEDGLRGREGTFLACTFWLAEVLAHQRRLALARSAFECAARCANDLGLFPEQYLPSAGQMLGNFPQGLTHLAHISAALALKHPGRVQRLLKRQHGSDARGAAADSDPRRRTR
jgi:GH15 family glucan-1,4-alpha-glucosidase